MTVPETVYLYRITHLNNLDFILKGRKVTCSSHSESDPDYINIGDTTLIQSRNNKSIMVAPYGSFSDYVAFYFGSKSPMLYNIQNGFQGVTKRKPQEIVYLVSSIDEIKKSGKPYVFTDGHAYHLMSQFFNTDNYLNEVDWKTVALGRWHDTEDDPDRKRRKQAEFLVHNELPLSSIVAFVVYDDEVKSSILSKFADVGYEGVVFVKPNWYY
jgi:hypothetical protein